jgi:hypothetical protein
LMNSFSIEYKCIKNKWNKNFGMLYLLLKNGSHSKIENLGCDTF